MGNHESIAEPRTLPVALTIAGSDNSAGAGAQADLKTFGAHDVYGLTAMTCIVAEVPGLVSAIQAVEPPLVAEQIRLAFEAFPVAAVKTGMLYSREIIAVIYETLADLAVRPPLVVDPVMLASSGDPLLQPDAVEAYGELLFPMATVITPNADELAVLAGMTIASLEDLRRAARTLCERFGVACLAKGGHLKGDRAVDYLVSPDGSVREFSAAFIGGVGPHGTGCTYSSAIAARLACGAALEDAVASAKAYITRAIKHHLQWGKRHAGDETTVCLNHFV